MHLAKGAKGKGQEVGTGLGCDQVRGGLSVTSVIRWVTGGGGAEEGEGRGAALRGNEARGAAGGPACGGLSPLCPSRGTRHPGSRWSVDAIESLGCGRALPALSWHPRPWQGTPTGSRSAGAGDGSGWAPGRPKLGEGQPLRPFSGGGTAVPWLPWGLDREGRTFSPVPRGRGPAQPHMCCVVFGQLLPAPSRSFPSVK